MKKYLIAIALVLSVAVLFSSCLKDKNVEDRLYGIQGTEDLMLVEIENSPDNLINLDYSLNDTTFSIVTVHANTHEPLSSPVTVTLEIDTTIVDDFNAENGTNYVSPPPGIFTIGNLAVTIPAGSRDGQLEFTAKPSDIAAGEYAIGFRIKSVSDPNFVISENYKEVIARLSVKNRWDGSYSLTSKMLDWDAAFGITNQVWTWPASYGLELITSSSTSVNMYSPAHGAYIHPAVTSAGGATGFGSTNPRFVFDLTTNELVNVVNDVAGSTRSFAVNPDPNFPSRYDPATKTIYAHIIMSQGGRPDLYIYDTLVYLGPR